MNPFCANTTKVVPFVYFAGGQQHSIALPLNTVIKILQIGANATVARTATTEHGCRDGTIPATDFYTTLPDCTTFPCDN